MATDENEKKDYVKILKNTGKQISESTKKIAGQTRQKASEASGKARDASKKFSKDVKIKLGQANKKAREMAKQAGETSGKISASGKKALSERLKKEDVGLAKIKCTKCAESVPLQDIGPDLICIACKDKIQPGIYKKVPLYRSVLAAAGLITATYTGAIIQEEWGELEVYQHFELVDLCVNSSESALLDVNLVQQKKLICGCVVEKTIIELDENVSDNYAITFAREMRKYLGECMPGKSSDYAESATIDYSIEFNKLLNKNGISKSEFAKLLLRHKEDDDFLDGNESEGKKILEKKAAVIRKDVSGKRIDADKYNYYYKVLKDSRKLEQDDRVRLVNTQKALIHDQYVNRLFSEVSQAIDRDLISGFEENEWND